MRTSDFDFELPPDRIAQHPAEPRDSARLMVVRIGAGTREHLRFRDLLDLLRPGDVLARNASKVVPARLIGRRAATGGAWEGLYLGHRPDGALELLAKTRGRPSAGERIEIEPPDSDSGPAELVLESAIGEGRWLARPAGADAPMAWLERVGRIPLPPYIRKGREGPGDREQYQTAYAIEPGSVAAPTAGLHFTPELLGRLAENHVDAVDLILHVGIGTFRPIAADRIEDHRLHSERALLAPEAADRLNAARAAGGRIVAVGTTAARTLETAAALGDGRLVAFEGETDFYIRPGHVFRGLDALVTNFHLPKSSLLVLVSALAGVDLVRECYREAIGLGYRFYSYGDAMLILP